MAHYLVTAQATGDLPALRRRLDSGEIRALRPFGKALDHSLRGARLRPDGTVVWEEEDYCSPPLAMERAAVLDSYFGAIDVAAVVAGTGWSRIDDLPALWAEWP